MINGRDRILARINIIPVKARLFVRSQGCVHSEWTVASLAFVYLKQIEASLTGDRLSVKSSSRAIKRRPVSAGRLRPVSRFAFCMINVQACGCFAYPALTNAHNSPQRHRSLWLMPPINCSRALKIGRIYIPRGSYLFPYMRYKNVWVLSLRTRSHK